MARIERTDALYPHESRHYICGEICDWFVYLTYNGQIVKSGRIGNGGNGVHDRDDKPVLPTPTTTCFPNIKEVLK